MSWHTPMGYEWKDGNIQISKDYSELVLKIFTDYDTGLSTTQIAKNLVKARIVNANGRVAWTHATVGRILENPKYIGTADYPQIVEKTLFDNVQIRREEQRKVHGTGVYKKSVKEKQLFEKTLICAKCGGFYKYHRREDIYPRWRCKSDIPPKKNPCNNSFLSQEQLKNICIYASNKYIQNSKLIERYAETEQKLSKEFRILDRKIQEAENLNADELMGLLFERAEERYKTLQVRDEVWQTEKMNGSIEDHPELEEFDEMIYRKLIKKIVIYPNHTVKVFFHNKDSLKVSYERL